MKKPKPKEIIPIHPEPKTHWLILKGRRRMNISPWLLDKPDLKDFKNLS